MKCHFICQANLFKLAKLNDVVDQMDPQRLWDLAVKAGAVMPKRMSQDDFVISVRRAEGSAEAPPSPAAGIRANLVRVAEAKEEE